MSNNKNNPQNFLFINEEDSHSDSFSNSSNKKEESSDDINIDDGRCTLIQINKMIQKKRKQKSEENMYIKNKKKKLEEHIRYDAEQKKILNSFCPNPEELKEFLENCEVIEIKDIKNVLSKPVEDVFDPDKFIEKNFLGKEAPNSLSVEDLFSIKNKIKNDNQKNLCLFEENNESYYEENHENLIEGAKIVNLDIYGEKKLINDIINNFSITNEQRKLFCDLMNKIKKMEIKDVLKNNNKLDIVLDLDNTCIKSVVLSKEALIELTKIFKEKEMRMFGFSWKGKTFYASIIIRKSLFEFINYVNPISNFHINTLGINNYGEKIRSIIEKNSGVSFKSYKGRINEEQGKYLNDLKVDINKTIIFDDQLDVWKNEFKLIITSKYFYDKETEIYIKINKKNKQKRDIFFNNILFSYSEIKNNIINQKHWRDQKIWLYQKCLFYQFKNINESQYNDCYCDEYLDSKKYQFDYMKNIIKIVYYLKFNYDMNIPEIIKLIRFHSLFNQYFYLKFLTKEKAVLIEKIIKVCGGDIYKEENNDTKTGKIFLVCSRDDYNIDPFKKESVKRFLKFNRNFTAITEKYVLDSYYFMTNLEDNCKDSEYALEKDDEGDDYDYL